MDGPLTVSLNYAPVITWLHMSYSAYHGLWFGVILTWVAQHGKDIRS